MVCAGAKPEHKRWDETQLVKVNQTKLSSHEYQDDTGFLHAQDTSSKLDPKQSDESAYFSEHLLDLITKGQ